MNEIALQNWDIISIILDILKGFAILALLLLWIKPKGKSGS